MTVRAGVVALLLGPSLLLFAAAPKPQPLPKMTQDAWRSDIDTVARDLPKRHLNAFHAVTRENFDRAVADLRAKVDTASDDELIVGLLQIAAMIGDGHTHLSPPSSVHRLPVAIALFGDDYRITRAAPDASEILGGKITRIGDTPIAEVEKRLRTVISQDESEPFVRGALPSYVLIGEILHGLHITPAGAHARITVATGSGEKTVEVDTLPAATNPMSWLSAAKEAPLFRQHVDDPLFVAYLEPAKTVYANFRRYDDLGSRSRALWTLVDSKAPGKIIIDLRQNGGGDYKVGRKYLVNELKARPKLTAYVLVGNRTFSAAMNNAVDFRNAHATLVGEPIGEKPNSYQENDEMTLPNSKMILSYSTRYYKFLPDDAPPIVTPDKVIAPTWDDFLAGRDPVLDWVLAQ